MDKFKTQMQCRCGPGGLRCRCCNKFRGKSRKAFRRIARRVLKDELKNDIRLDVL